MVRGEPFNTRSTMCAARVSRFPPPPLPDVLDQRVAGYYIDPNFRWSKWGATTSILAERDEENPVYSSQVENGSHQFQRFLDKKKHDVFFLRYSFSQTDLTRILIPELVLPQDQHVRLSTIAANFTHDTRDNPLDAHKGMLQTVELDLNATKLGSSVNFAKLTGQAAYYRPVFHNIVWANSIRIGLAQPFSNSRVPLSQAFFTGGGNTLRGFPLDARVPSGRCRSAVRIFHRLFLHPGAEPAETSS